MKSPSSIIEAFPSCPWQTLPRNLQQKLAVFLQCLHFSCSLRQSNLSAQQTLTILAVPRPPSRPRWASGALGPSSVVREMAPGSPEPQAQRARVSGGPGSADPGHIGALSAFRGHDGKGPETPGTWGPSGALRGPRVLFPQAIASGPPGRGPPELLWTSRLGGSPGASGALGARERPGPPGDPRNP